MFSDTDVSGSSCIFHAPTLMLLQTALVPFSDAWYLETKIWLFTVLIAPVYTHICVYRNTCLHTYIHRRTEISVSVSDCIVKPHLFVLILPIPIQHPRGLSRFHVQNSLLKVRNLAPFIFSVFTYLFNVANLPHDSGCLLGLPPPYLPALLTVTLLPVSSKAIKHPLRLPMVFECWATDVKKWR